MDFAAPSESDFEEQIRSWKGSLGETEDSQFNPETSKYFSSNALSDSRRVRLDRKKAEREAKAKSSKPKPKASK